MFVRISVFIQSCGELYRLYFEKKLKYLRQNLSEIFRIHWEGHLFWATRYNECRPSRCRYSEKAKNNAIYIVTTLVSLIASGVQKWRIANAAVLPVGQI